MNHDSSQPQLIVGRPMEILLVEDSLLDAHITIAALKDGGIKHRLTLIRDGMETMEFLLQQNKFSNAPRPDLILLDLLLPKKDGLEVLAEIRADHDLLNIPVVILTASDQTEDQEKCEFLAGGRIHVQARQRHQVSPDRPRPEAILDQRRRSPRNQRLTPKWRAADCRPMVNFHSVVYFGEVEKTTDETQVFTDEASAERLSALLSSVLISDHLWLKARVS